MLGLYNDNNGDDNGCVACAVSCAGVGREDSAVVCLVDNVMVPQKLGRRNYFMVGTGIDE